jgi:1-acyl-sn-glycerol-3-phosphate acyltransferase
MTRGTLVARVPDVTSANSGTPLAGDDVAFEPFHGRGLLTRATLGVGGALRRYHRHRVRGMEHLAAALAHERPVILVSNHCFDIVDPLMLAVAIHGALGRWPRFIGHGNLFFTLPVLRSLAAHWGVIPNRHMALADAVLREEGLLMLYPGSGTEAILRSYRREPYRLKWYGKLGFVELAARHHATLLFVAAIGIDELYYQTNIPAPATVVRYGNAGDADHYRGARVQLGAAGLHVLPGILPLPVRVTHVIAPPIALDPGLDPSDRAALETAQIRIWAECQALLDGAVAARARDSDALDAVCRRSLDWLYRTGL